MGFHILSNGAVALQFTPVASASAEMPGGTPTKARRTLRR